MEKFERHARSLFESQSGKGPVLPGVVVAAQNTSGSFKYSKAFGNESIDADIAKPLKEDSVFWIASCTKIVTAIAAMQCVEKGLLKLDEDVMTVLPEWEDVHVLVGFDEKIGKAITRPPRGTITLRLLLTHMSGMDYDHLNPAIQKYRETIDLDPQPKRDVIKDSHAPILVFDPNTEFHYSPALDWTGQMIERVNNMTLRQYFSKNIIAPLGITDLTFHLEEHPDMRSRVCGAANRQEDATLVQAPIAAGRFSETVTDDWGGAGLWRTADSYLSILLALISDDEKLLQRGTVDDMLRPQIKDVVMLKKGLMGGDTMIDALRVMSFGSLPENTRVNYGLTGVLTCSDVERQRRRGSISWSGLPNCHWWADRASGVAGGYLSQLVPRGDIKSVEFYRDFEKAVYQQI